MAITAEARQALERRMEERRIELSLRWREVAEAAKMTYEGVRGVRKGPTEIPDFTRRKLERALKWSAGEIDRILGDNEDAEIPELTDDEIATTSFMDLARHTMAIQKAHGQPAADAFFVRAGEVIKARSKVRDPSS